MQPSREYIQRYARATNFQPDILEKVFRLLDLLRELSAHPRLREKLVLKGGTAINLFYLSLPRLSVDIDFNYIGALPRETMLAERPQVVEDLEGVFQAQGYRIGKEEELFGGKVKALETLMAGEYRPELLFKDPVLATRVKEHPAILWRLEGMRRHGPEPQPQVRRARRHRAS